MEMIKTHKKLGNTAEFSGSKQTQNKRKKPASPPNYPPTDKT